MRYTGTAISLNGKYILVTSNSKNGYDNVALLDATTKMLRWVTRSAWASSAGAFSPDAFHFTYEVNNDGRRDIYLAECIRGAPGSCCFHPVEITEWVHSNFHRMGGGFLCCIRRPTHREISGCMTRKMIRPIILPSIPSHLSAHPRSQGLNWCTIEALMARLL